MHINAEKSKENKAIPSQVAQLKTTNDAVFHFEDNRPQATIQRKIQKISEAFSAKHILPIQRKATNTGLPDTLKSGIEQLSGYAMDDVKVHYNSDKPAQLQAHAFAQGTNIHVASGQEKHLPHEAWHVVQQKQGRVKPTVQLKGNVNINTDVSLEKEADIMGAKAVTQRMPLNHSNKDITNSASLISNHDTVVQAVLDPTVATGDQDFTFGLLHGTYRPATNLADMHVNAATLANPHLTAAHMLAAMNDVQQAMIANHGVTGNVGTLDWRPTGAAVVKLVIELLGEALGGFWNKRLARLKKFKRKKLETPPVVRNEDALSADVLSEHKSSLKSLQGENKVSIKPIIARSTLAEFNQDMLENSPAGKARLTAYEQLIDAGLPTSLRIEIHHNQIPAIIGVLNSM
ncbi:hypothetical protein IMCC3317_15950 [Kordia antarctica]|uniref:eCIS core domain-containing protein n=1 Tax=Kordia antarctica TaxID=1218801 RepID=A0A7L4ZJ62_9FLAO|nr:DUF4157 domain-containing protein [Kordia antarctica]QHI36236.1 hypothetical protein IMCC3317_15950 [Kordia antarctica]